VKLETIARAAKAIERLRKRTHGMATSWALALEALSAAGVSGETSVSDERVAKSMLKTKRYAEANSRGWKTRKRAAARAAAAASAEAGEEKGRRVA
jgi:hypothetical protein